MGNRPLLSLTGATSLRTLGCMTKRGKRSPFPRPSLPQPGESLGDAAQDLFFDRFFFYFLMGAAFAIVAWVEWIAIWTGKGTSPWFWTALPLLLLALSGWRYLRIRPQLEALRRGIRGEREVGGRRGTTSFPRSGRPRCAAA